MRPGFAASAFVAVDTGVPFTRARGGKKASVGAHRRFLSGRRGASWKEDAAVEVQVRPQADRFQRRERQKLRDGQLVPPEPSSPWFPWQVAVSADSRCSTVPGRAEDTVALGK